MSKSIAFLTGISDFFFKDSKKDRRKKPPVWMDKLEASEWKKGFEYAKTQVR